MSEDRHTRRPSRFVACIAALAVAGCAAATAESPASAYPASAHPAATSERRPSFGLPEQGFGLDGARGVAPMLTAGAVPGVPTYGTAFRLPGHEIWLTPFSLVREVGWFADADPFTRGGEAADSGKDRLTAFADQLATRSIRWHNAIFTHPVDGEAWALLDRRGVLSRYWALLTPGDGEGAAIRTSALVFAATVRDSNEDGKLDDRDASVAILTAGDGRSSRVVTPADAQVAGVHLVPEEGLLVFQLRFDGDGSGAFDPGDPLEPYRLRLGSDEAVARPWVPRDLTDRLGELYR